VPADLRPFPWLTRGLPRADQSAVRDVVALRRLEPGEVVIEAGAATDRLVLILEGALEVSEPAPPALVLGRKERGGFLGEMGLLSPGPASARVAAVGPAVVGTLDHAALVRLRNEHPRAAAHVVRAICVDLSERIRRLSAAVVGEDGVSPRLLRPLVGTLLGMDRASEPAPTPAPPLVPAPAGAARIVEEIERVAAFRPPSDEDDAYRTALRMDVRWLAQFMTVVGYADGATLWEEGAEADGTYVILSGGVRVVVRRSGALLDVDRVLRPGEVVGLIAFFQGGRRSATCTAAGPTRIARIPAHAMRVVLAAIDSGVTQGVHLLDWFGRQLVADARALNERLRAAVPPRPA
jgi:CRP-like cAMP-binding protein